MDLNLFLKQLKFQEIEIFLILFFFYLCISDGKIVPEESSFNILIYSLHRNPEIFHNPDDFDPERFNTTDNIERTNPYSYIPFSAGPRNCIGQKFAMLEMKSTVSKILRHYQLINRGPDPKLMMLVTLKPKNSALEIGFKKRMQ